MTLLGGDLEETEMVIGQHIQIDLNRATKDFEHQHRHLLERSQYRARHKVLQTITREGVLDFGVVACFFRTGVGGEGVTAEHGDILAEDEEEEHWDAVDQ